MKFGLLLDPGVDGDWPSQFGVIREMAHLAESHRLDLLVAPQHLASPTLPLLEPVSVLSRLSAEASLRLATGVVVAPFVPPLLLAESVATLDVISGGRAVLGLGAGHRIDEFAAFGLVPSERGTRLEEVIRTVREAWSEGRGVTPLQRPGPPIWVAGTSDGGVRRAALLGDAWYVNPGASIEAITRQLVDYDDTRASAGLPPATELPVRRDIYLLGTDRGPAELAHALADRDRRQEASGFAHDLSRADRLRRADRRNQGCDAVGSEVVAGTPEACAEQLRQFSAAVGRETVVVLRVGWRGLGPDGYLRHLATVLGLLADI